MDSAAVLVFRLAVVLALYLFVAEAVRAVWRDLRRAAEPAASSVTSATLQIVNPARAPLVRGERIALRGATNIGREPDNDVVVDEDSVSGRHARVLPREGRWWIEDLDSTNGTLVNDDQVRGTRPLKPGDLIQLGRVSLRFAA